jgi:broad specificity phosphatase PhoE
MAPSHLPVYLIRHAKAGSRSRWSGIDEQRPLSGSGRRQAAALVMLFDNRPLERLFTSPALRCIQTLEPLVAARGLPIEIKDALREGAPREEVQPLFERALEEGGLALCSHGDIVELLLDYLDERGIPLEGRRPSRKGSLWILERKKGVIASGHYLQPEI